MHNFVLSWLWQQPARVLIDSAREDHMATRHSYKLARLRRLSPLTWRPDGWSRGLATPSPIVHHHRCSTDRQCALDHRKGYMMQPRILSLSLSLLLCPILSLNFLPFVRSVPRLPTAPLPLVVSQCTLSFPLALSLSPSAFSSSETTT